MKILVTIFLSFSVSASSSRVSFMSENSRYGRKVREKLKTDKVALNSSSTSKKRVHSSIGKVISLEKENSRLKRLVSFRLTIPDIIDNSFSILTGDMFKGTLEQNVLSTNLASPVNVKLGESTVFPSGARIICKGSTYLKRVSVVCHTLITNGVEYSIDANILEADGSFGLKGKYYTGKEEYIAGILATEVSKGALALSLQRQTTINGDVIKNSPTNALVGGAISAGNAVSEMMTDEMKSKEPKVFIRRGKNVILYFSSSFQFEAKERF